LHVAVVGQQVQGPGELDGGGLVAGDEEGDQLIAELLVGEGRAIVVAGGEQAPEQVAPTLPRRPASADQVEEDRVQGGALAGQYLGAGSTRLARIAIWRCTLIGIDIMGVMGVVFILLGRPLTRIISSDPLHLELVPQLLMIAGFAQGFFALAMVVRNGLRGVGDTKWILAITVVSCFAIRLPLAWYLGIHLGHGLVGIWWGLMIELSLRGLFFLARF
jgi:MATE family multidrug resistance protein